MVYSLELHKDAKGDIDALWQSDPIAAAVIATGLEEIEDDQRLLDGLTDHGFGADGSEPIDVKKWVAFWSKGADIWRLKFWDLERIGLSYRVIYAYQPGRLRYYVLGVFPRAFNYALDDPRTQRVKRAYDNL